MEQFNNTILSVDIALQIMFSHNMCLYVRTVTSWKDRDYFAAGEAEVSPKYLCQGEFFYSKNIAYNFKDKIMKYFKEYSIEYTYIYIYNTGIHTS